MNKLKAEVAKNVDILKSLFYSTFPPFKVLKALYSKKPLIHSHSQSKPVYAVTGSKFGKVFCPRTQQQYAHHLVIRRPALPTELLSQHGYKITTVLPSTSI